MGDYGQSSQVAEQNYHQPHMDEAHEIHSGHLMNQQRNSVDESLPAGDRSRPSTDLRDLEQVQGGYTEFFSWGNDDKG